MAFHFNLEIVKKHPLAFGGGAVFLFLVIYLLSKSGSSSSATVASDSSQPSAAELAAQTANNQTNAQLTVAQLSAQVQTNNTNQQAAVTNLQTQAQLNATNNQTAAQLQAVQYTTLASVQQTALASQAQTSINEANDITQQNIVALQTNASTTQQLSNNATELGVIQSNNGVLNNQLTEAANVQINGQNDNLSAIQNTNASQVQATQIQATYLAGVSNNQTAIAQSTLADQTTIAGQQIQAQHDTTSQALQLVSSGQLNKGGEGGALQAGVVESIFGANPSSANAVAQTSSNNSASIINSITNAGTSLLKGLFA